MDLNKIRDLQNSEYRIPPAFLTSKLTQIGSFVINPAILGLESVSKGMILDLHEIMESNIDESLILMNEAGLEEKDLRKVFSFVFYFFN